MPIQRRTLAAGLIAAAITSHGLADEQNVNVTTIVNISVPDAIVSGIEDLEVQINEVPQTGDAPLGAVSEFCLFTPTNFFSMTITGANRNASGDFLLANTDPNDSLQNLNYDVAVLDTFSDPASPVPISSNTFFSNGVTETAIDSNPFNSDATCTDGENLTLFAQLVIGPPTRLALEQIADGQPHTFTDTLTILVEPDL